MCCKLLDTQRVDHSEGSARGAVVRVSFTTANMQGPPGSVMLVPEPGFCFKGQRERWIEVRRPALRVPDRGNAHSSQTSVLVTVPDVPSSDSHLISPNITIRREARCS